MTLIVKGKVGKVGMPTSSRIYPIVQRELEKYMTFSSVHKAERYAVTHYEQHDIGMEAIAEACCTPDEVKAMVRPLMEAAFRRAQKTHMPVRQARSQIYLAALKFLGEHFYHLPQKKVHVEGWSKRYLKGYQKWWRRVESEEKRIRRKHEKNGTCGNSKAEALWRVSPELYPEARMVSGEFCEA